MNYLIVLLLFCVLISDAVTNNIQENIDDLDAVLDDILTNTTYSNDIEINSIFEKGTEEMCSNITNNQSTEDGNYMKDLDTILDDMLKYQINAPAKNSDKKNTDNKMAQHCTNDQNGAFCGHNVYSSSTDTPSTSYNNLHHNINPNLHTEDLKFENRQAKQESEIELENYLMSLDSSW